MTIQTPATHTIPLTPDQARIQELESQLAEALETADTLHTIAVSLLDLTARYMHAFTATTNALHALEGNNQ
jgi:uncharacterized coiled-coil protein SlyX